MTLVHIQYPHIIHYSHVFSHSSDHHQQWVLLTCERSSYAAGSMVLPIAWLDSCHLQFGPFLYGHVNSKLVHTVGISLYTYSKQELAVEKLTGKEVYGPYQHRCGSHYSIHVCAGESLTQWFMSSTYVPQCWRSTGIPPNTTALQWSTLVKVWPCSGGGLSPVARGAIHAPAGTGTLRKYCTFLCLSRSPDKQTLNEDAGLAVNEAQHC